MAKEFDVLKEQANVIKNEVEDGANTASRVGGMFVDVVEKIQDEHIDVVQELGDDEDAVMSQKTVTYVTNAIDRILCSSSRFSLENKIGDEVALMLKTNTYLNALGNEVTGISSFTVGEYSLTEDDRNTNSYLVCDFIFAGASAIAVAYYDSSDNFIGTHDFTGLGGTEAYEIKTILRTDEKVAKIKLCAYQSSPKLYRMYPNDNRDYLRVAFGSDIFPNIIKPDSIEAGKQISSNGTIVNNQNMSVGVFNDLSNIDKIAVYSFTNQGINNIAYYDADDNLLSIANGNETTEYQYVLLQKPELATKARVCWVDKLSVTNYVHTIFAAKQMNGYEKATQLNLSKAPITNIWRDGSLTDTDMKIISSIKKCILKVPQERINDRFIIAVIGWGDTTHFDQDTMCFWIYDLDSDDLNLDGNFVLRFSLSYESDEEIGIKSYHVDNEKVKAEICVDFLKLKKLFPQNPSIKWDVAGDFLFVTPEINFNDFADALGNNRNIGVNQQGLALNVFDYVDNINRILLSSKVGSEITNVIIKESTYLNSNGKEVTGDSYKDFFVTEYSYTDSDRLSNCAIVCDFNIAGTAAYAIAYYDKDDNFLFRHPIQGLEGKENYYRVKMLLHKYKGIAKVKLSGHKEKPKLFSIPLYGVEDSNISGIKNIIGDYNSINDYTSIQDSLTQVDGYYLNNDGVVGELNNFAYTDYYSAENIVSLRVDTRLGEVLGIIFWYDEYYNILSSVTPKVSSEGVVKSVYSEKPEGAVWFRTSYYTNDGLYINVYAAYGQTDLITYINKKQNIDSSPIENLKRIVFIPIYGQSLSVGGESTPAITKSPKYNSLKFNTGTISRPSSPDAVTSFIPLKEDSSETSSSGTSEMFIETLMRENALYAYSKAWDNVQLLFVCPGQGSSSIEYLSNDEEGGHYNYFKNCLQAAKNICDDNGYTIEVPAWCWIQGETDIKEGNSKSVYYEALLSLQNKINSDVKSIIGQTNDVKCICYQTGCQCLYTQNYDFNNNQMDVLTAQMEAVRDNDAFMASIPMYMMDHVIGANIHITNISEKLLGAYQGYVLKRYLIDKEMNKGVCPLSFTVSENDILVKYSVPCPPLEFDTNYVRETKNMGYTCIKPDNSDIIESVSLYNDTVTIHCSETPVGCKLRYALNGESIVIPPSSKTGNSGREYGGRGNLRDSQGYHVYKDIEGIKYPLHNWAYAFERMI
jgi:hypothetical protein